MNSSFEKIVSLNKLDKILADVHKKKVKIVIVGGCFDIFHYGHLVFLTKAKKQGDFLIVLLESDDFIKKNKKREPIHNISQRAKILAELACVDLVVLLSKIFKDEDYLKITEKIKPATIAVTRGDKKLPKKKEIAQKVKAKLKIVTRLLPEFSTSLIRKRLKLT